MFTDFLSDSQIRDLRKSEADGLYTSWPVEMEGPQPDVKVLRCWRCGSPVCDIESLSEDELSKITFEQWVERFPIMRVVSLELKDGNILPVVTCDLCQEKISENENPQRILYVLAALWSQYGEAVGASKRDIRAKMVEIEGLEILGEQFKREN